MDEYNYLQYPSDDDLQLRDGSRKVVIELRIVQFWTEIILGISN